MALKYYYIQTFGCQQNKADSERIAAQLKAQGMLPADNMESADHLVINTCMIRQSAENRVYSLAYKLWNEKKKGRKIKVILTGCMVGMAVRDKTGKFLRTIKKRLPGIDEFLPIEEVGFDHQPLRTNSRHAWVPISNGCNNFCTFCVVPFTRGREISRPFAEILAEVASLASEGYRAITLLGMNVNSYGADLVVGAENIQVLRDVKRTYFDNKKELENLRKTKVQGYKLPDGRIVEPIRVNHLGRLRIPTLFPYLLEEVCKIDGIEKVEFISSNPWDFSDELIEVIAVNPKISRLIHLPVQSGSDAVLRRMNRWYTKDEYIQLVDKIRRKIPEAEFSTDIIVGFCGETEEEFAETVDLVKKVRFKKAYIAQYSDRPLTAAHKVFRDDVPPAEKKRRWEILENIINRKRKFEKR